MNTAAEATGAAFDALQAWYDSHRPDASQDPERYVVCAGLAILELAREKLPLKPADYMTPRNQVRTGGPLIRHILARYGETRTYAREGGRTTRGTRPAAESLVDALNSLHIVVKLPDEQRQKIIDVLQRWLVDRVREYFDRQKIELEIHLDNATPQIIFHILQTAKERGAAGPVAQHLVGAKLALRYPHLEIENHSFTTADEQLGRPGDFLVGDTVFHVTVSPMPAVIDKANENLRHDYRAILLVPDSSVPGAKAMVHTLELEGKLGVLSIEAFVGQNLDEMSEFKKDVLPRELYALLETYNTRVLEVETDRSLLIEIPHNLVRH